MATIGWLAVITLFLIGMIGAIYPIFPGALAIYGAFFVYGLCISFEPFDWMFWAIQTSIVVILFISNYAVSAWGIKRFGGSKASTIGSTIGVLIGPLFLPVIGIFLGPLFGAFLGELLTGANMHNIVKATIGSFVGLFTSIIVTIALQLVMIVLFFVWVF